MVKNFGAALAALLLVAGCANEASVETRRLQEEDRQAVLSTLGTDIDAQAGALVAACIATLDGRTPDDAGLTAAPFSKTREGDTLVYKGRWQGQHGYETGGTLLEAGPTECRFPSVDRFGMAQPGTRPNGGYVTEPRPEVTRQLQQAGYRVSAYAPVTLGGAFARGALGGLTPGRVQRIQDGTMTATRDGQRVQVRVFAFKAKSNLATVGTLVTIGTE